MYKNANQYAGFRFALKYMGDGLITQLIAPSGNATLTVPSNMSLIANVRIYYATTSSKIEDVSCNNTYGFLGYNNGGAVTGISGSVNIDERRYIAAGNGCLRSYIKWVPNNLFASNHKLTIMCWVYLTGHKDYDTIAGFDDGNTAIGMSFGIHSGYLKLSGGINGLANASTIPNILLSTSTWHHVCATMRLDVSGYGVITYYVNGVNRGTFNETAENNKWNTVNSIPANSTFYVGKYGFLGANNTASSYALNRINYLRLYNNELSQSDILAYYNSNT
jgi:hypothetical protein